MPSKAWLQFQRVLKAQREDPDEFGFEPELRRRWAPTPTPPKVPMEHMRSDDNVIEQECAPALPRAAVDEDGGGEKKYTDVEHSAEAPSDECEDLLLCYTATEVALPESSGDDKDDAEGDEPGSDGDEARLIPRATAGTRMTAIPVADDSEGTIDRHLINTTLQHTKIAPSDHKSSIHARCWNSRLLSPLRRCHHESSRKPIPQPKSRI